MILLITGNYPVEDHLPGPPEYEFVVSHGVDLETGCNIVLPQDHPIALGAVYDKGYGEWVLKDKDNT